MTTIDQHREYMKSAQVRLSAGGENGAARCKSCGCDGNAHCGHSPLAAPEHHCELNVNGPGETGECYCCETVKQNKE